MGRHVVTLSSDKVAEPWRTAFTRGLNALKEGAFPLALSHFSQAYRLNPERAEVLYAYGREKLRVHAVEEAEALLRAAWNKDPSLLSAACMLARCLGLHLNRAEDALSVLAKASLAPLAANEVAAVEVVRAEMYLELGRFELARAAAEEAAEHARPDSAAAAAACAALARVENQDGVELASTHPEAALFAFKRAADLDPDWSAPLVNMGAAFARMGRMKRARSCYESALDIDPQNPLAHANLGRWFADNDRPRQAIRAFQAALRLDPRDTGTLAALAKVRSRL